MARRKACVVRAMRVDSPLNATAAGSLRASALEVCRGEKSSLSSQLGQQPRDGRQPQPEKAPSIPAQTMSRNGTTAFDPLWDRPRLVPAFVTQVLGQMMPHNSEPEITVETAYGIAAPRRSLLVDRTS